MFYLMQMIAYHTETKNNVENCMKLCLNFMNSIKIHFNNTKFRVAEVHFYP